MIKTLEQMKHEYILKVFSDLEYRKYKTAKALGITPKSLYNFLKKNELSQHIRKIKRRTHGTYKKTIETEQAQRVSSEAW